MAEDTDIFALLLYHRRDCLADIYFVSETKKGKKGKMVGGKCINVDAVQRKIGRESCERILVLHALVGCDTTSAIYGHGKGTVFSKINKDSTMHLHCATLQNSEASVDDVCKTGVRLMVAIYGGKPGDSLECLRYAAYCSTSLSRRFQAERLPPSESAARLHAMRVHLQAVVWGTLGRSALKPTQWGWSLNNGRLGTCSV
jgi:hypothetical protein